MMTSLKTILLKLITTDFPLLSFDNFEFEFANQNQIYQTYKNTNLFRIFPNCQIYTPKSDFDQFEKVL